MHVDWLTVRQSHGVGSCPVFADQHLLAFDAETGEAKWEKLTGRPHEGSFKTSLRICSDGDTVTVSGNPSRFNREENIFGVPSVDAALDVYNGVLAVLGLPAFYGDERTRLHRLQSCDAVAHSGCVITRVDLTENYSAGGPRNAEHALHALRAMRYRDRPPTDYGTTLMWGGHGSRHATMKYYLKGPEMRKHRPAEPSEYWEQCYSYVCASGVLRFECTLKSEYLRRRGLHRLEAWNVQVMREIMDERALHGRSETSVDSWDGIADELMALGVPEGRARRAQVYAKAYRSGEHVRGQMARSSFYKLRRDLLLVGIDIAAELNVSALRFSVQPIELRPLEMPEWYRAA
jgi:hypothetical protein